MRIGIFGGSFNPVHNGHLKLAREAMSELNLDRVIFVPSCHTPLKSGQTLLPVDLRVRLLKKAVEKLPGFSVSLCEARRKGVSYTVDTLKFFKKKFGKNAVLYFLSGADTLKNLARWKKKNEVLDLCRFIVMTRPGYAPVKLPEKVHFLPMDALEVSSSEIRNRLKNKMNLDKLIPNETKAMLMKYYSEEIKKGRSFVGVGTPPQDKFARLT